MASITFKGNPVTLIGSKLQAGDQAPDFTVLSNSLEEVTLSDIKGKIAILSVVPSIDTGVCDAQTRRFNEEAAGLGSVNVYTISADLPFAQKRWCGANGIENVETLSDHREMSFGEAFGVYMKELRLLARAVFVLDENGVVTYAEYVKEVTNHPNYEKALEAAQSLVK
ncbi:thiol peroxidase [Bacillus sp. CLL-7-23]|uniref:Thiol peroxidase n=1 Tax=Bacillus changyiensis TaxID=3004103 RepID=A0ABT4X677_9BACI|nr:thiol peroxidase [Bacillus changyiensis]MDA7027224.1 thiol peroxidase [Bacillus changyiensis]